MPRQPEINEKVLKAIKVILDECNGGNRRDITASILQAVQTDHRTLQQAFWSVMLLAQIGYAETPNDLRNEQAVELAKAVKELAIARGFDCGLAYL
jgi:hypothetical protein